MIGVTDPPIATICMDEQGEVFVWVLKQPRETMKEMPYHTTESKRYNQHKKVGRKSTPGQCNVMAFSKTF